MAEILISPPKDVYMQLSQVGMRKAYRAEHRLFASSVLAGLIVGFYGHCCTMIASKMYSSPLLDTSERGTATLVYAVLFTGAFQAIIVSGTDLFTSNLLYGLCFLSTYGKDNFEQRYWLRLLLTLKQWCIVYVGNLTGCVIAAALLVNATNSYHHDEVATAYLCNTVHHKVSDDFGTVVVNAIGANFFVGLATIALNSVRDGIGILFCVMLPVINFCVGGFQHCIANMFTTMAGAFLEPCNIEQSQIWVDNIIPATIGNFIASGILCLSFFFMYNDWLGIHYWSEYHDWHDDTSLEIVRGSEEGGNIVSADEYVQKILPRVTTHMNTLAHMDSILAIQ